MGLLVFAGQRLIISYGGRSRLTCPLTRVILIQVGWSLNDIGGQSQEQVSLIHVAT